MRAPTTGGSLGLDDRQSAYNAGYEAGLAYRTGLDVKDQVHAVLHTQALEALGMAQRLARTKGPAWAAMIEEAGEFDER